MAYPFLTLPDPKTIGEGALDPLGLSTIGERLADCVLPGLRVRMARPRFLTVMAVAAHVCDGLDDEFRSDTPAYLVFEWLLVEGFVRRSSHDLYRHTPGTQKALAVTSSDAVMGPSTYLRIPTVFGVHGVYKPLARDLGIVREAGAAFHLDDVGYELLKVWQHEQGLGGFLEPNDGGPGATFRTQLRDAVQRGLRDGYTRQSAGWSGWQRIAAHLIPGSLGRREAAFLNELLCRSESGIRGEVFRHLASRRRGDWEFESELVKGMIAETSPALSQHLRAIAAFEEVGRRIEAAFDLLRWSSSMNAAQGITADAFAAIDGAEAIPGDLRRAIDAADAALQCVEPEIQTLFSDLARYFDRATTPQQLFEAVLERHSAVQQAKPPDGKRDWFEPGAGGAVFVRVPYQLREPVEMGPGWRRPYRLTTVRSFLDDFRTARNG